MAYGPKSINPEVPGGSPPNLFPNNPNQGKTPGVDTGEGYFDDAGNWVYTPKFGGGEKLPGGGGNSGPGGNLLKFGKKQAISKGVKAITGGGGGGGGGGIIPPPIPEQDIWAPYRAAEEQRKQALLTQNANMMQGQDQNQQGMSFLQTLLQMYASQQGQAAASPYRMM